MSKEKNIKQNDAKAKEEPRPRIPEGEYEAVCINVEVSIYLGREKKLYAHFEIVDGLYLGTKLFEVFNYSYKSFPIGSKYYTDWSIAKGARPRRKNQMSPRVFLKKAYLVKVKDVKPKYTDGETMPKMFWYSKVDRIIEKVAG